MIDKRDVDCILIIAKQSNLSSILSGLQYVDSVKLPSLISMHHTIGIETRLLFSAFYIPRRFSRPMMFTSHVGNCPTIARDFPALPIGADEAGVTLRKHRQTKCSTDWVIIAHLWQTCSNLLSSEKCETKRAIRFEWFMNSVCKKRLRDEATHIPLPLASFPNK